MPATPPGRISRRRSVISFERARTGDIRSRDAAGGNIYHGADADGLLSFLRDYVFLDEQRREIRQAEVDDTTAALRRSIERLADELELYQHSGRQRREVADARQRRIELWLIVLTLAWVVGGGLLVWVLVSQLGQAGALERLWAGALAALAWAWGGADG